MKKLNSVLLVVALTLISCQTEGPRAVSASAPVVPKEANLTKVEAQMRAEAVSQVSYALAIALERTSQTFAGDAKISFTLAGPQDLFLDFKNGATIESLTINGKSTPPVFSEHRVSLPAALLTHGENVVEIKYQQTYSHDGRGLHRFVDPQDNKVYLYTQFEDFDAHQMFPCFDQPDLKAVLTLTVTAPNSWQVISTTRESRIKNIDAGQRQWIFPETPRISTYLFSLHAGPYYQWKSQAGSIPLRLFARQSLKRFVHPNDWFTPTKQGLKFYGDYFAFPYPFKKYDQVIVPEFNPHAMENVAAVTFRESFVHRGSTTRMEEQDLTETVLHEMAHMWFGDLVTMKWWNDIWLNESFATIMSHIATQATDFKDTWMSFHGYGKSRAYVEDQRVTTHPIEANIADTNASYSNFDHITYGKGASALKQLRYYLGADVFRDGVRSYFKTYAYQNTRLEDFIGSLEAVSGKNLQAWAANWLTKAGLDSVQAEYTCKDGKIDSFALLMQGPNGEAPTRVHRTRVGFLQMRGSSLISSHSEEVEYQGPNTAVPAVVGTPCPLAVYPNLDDEDYVKVRLDKRSLATVQNELSKVESNFTRLMLWGDLISMVRDVELSPRDFLKIVERQFPAENNLDIVESVLGDLPTMLYYLPQGTELARMNMQQQTERIERMLWKMIEPAKADVDRQRLALDAYMLLVRSQDGQAMLVDLLNGKIHLKGQALDLDQKWGMVIRLAALGNAQADAFKQKLGHEDSSDRGVEFAMAVEATKPEMAAKQAWLKRMVEQDEMSYTQKRTVMGYFLPPFQDDLRASLAKTYFQTLPDLIKSRALNFLALYANSLIPTTCTERSAADLAAYVDKRASEMPPPVLKALRVGQQEDSRCVAIRAHATL